MRSVYIILNTKLGIFAKKFSKVVKERLIPAGLDIQVYTYRDLLSKIKPSHKINVKNSIKERIINIDKRPFAIISFNKACNDISDAAVQELPKYLRPVSEVHINPENITNKSLGVYRKLIYQASSLIKIKSMRRLLDEMFKRITEI